MGSVFGRQSFSEPPYDILLKRSSSDVATSYEIRKYGKRYAAICAFNSTSTNSINDMGSPFQALADYIGVFGKAQNEGEQKISMTTPVVLQDGSSSEDIGTTISMTAPVVTEHSSNGEMVMKFILPSKYDSLTQIPKPLNPSIQIQEIPSQTGAVHRFNGSWNSERNLEIAANLGSQLRLDGVSDISPEYVFEHWQFWAYNPPFTIPQFRRNEVWLELNSNQVDYLTFHYKISKGTYGAVTAFAASPFFTIDNKTGCFVIVMILCSAVGVWWKSRRVTYARL